MAVDSSFIFIGIIGIGVVIALMVFLYKSGCFKNRDRVTYSQNVKRYLVIFLCLTIILAIGSAFVIDMAIALMLEFGLGFLVAGATAIYIWPRGIVGVDVRTSKWRTILAVGVTMVIAGFAYLVIFPSSPEDATIGPIPAYLIGIGVMIAILSLTSFKRAEELRPDH